MIVRTYVNRTSISVLSGLIGGWKNLLENRVSDERLMCFAEYAQTSERQIVCVCWVSVGGNCQRIAKQRAYTRHRESSSNVGCKLSDE